MSIVIHGMKMPKDGEFIVLTSDGVASKYLAGDVAIYYDAHPDKASAVELPPHGRLIDADALFKAMFRTTEGGLIGDHSIDGWPFEMPYKEIKRFIRHAPVIVPADPEGGDANARESRISFDVKRPHGGRQWRC